MDSPPPARGSSQRKRILIWLIAVACFVVATIGTIISSNKPAPEPNFVWLDQTQFARQMHPGRLKRLYYKVVNFTAPLWQHFRPPKTQINITSKILAVHDLTNGQLDIGSSMATNETGVQVWLLSPPQLDDLRQRLKTAHGFELVNAPSLTTVDGLPGSMFVGYAHPKTLASIGVCLDLSPKIVAHQFQLAVNAVYTEECDSQTMGVRTNLSAACRVTLQNAGGVLITSPMSKDKSGTNNWLILSSTAIDGFGNPIKL
jgi:hypothetical protein